MVFRECLEALIVCTGNRKIVQFHGRDNTVGEIKKYPTIMLEVVASQDLWIWHAFFGVAGANNDINILDNSPLFDDLLNDTAPVVPYVVNGVGYEKGYYLADDQKIAVFDWNEVYANPSRNMQRTWIERCETQRRKNKEMRDRDTHVKENQEKDKIGSKPDKNGKRGESGRSLKQL
nr:protein ALP1-like [Tanacetum cinerariifolium]